jgi:hypothetical protein
MTTGPEAETPINEFQRLGYAYKKESGIHEVLTFSNVDVIRVSETEITDILDRTTSRCASCRFKT